MKIGNTGADNVGLEAGLISKSVGLKSYGSETVILQTTRGPSALRLSPSKACKLALIYDGKEY